MVYKIGVQTSKFLIFIFIFVGVIEVSFQLLRLLWAGNRLGTIYKFNLILVQICCRARERRLGSGAGSMFLMRKRWNFILTWMIEIRKKEMGFFFFSCEMAFVCSIASLYEQRNFSLLIQGSNLKWNIQEGGYTRL